MSKARLAGRTLSNLARNPRICGRKIDTSKADMYPSRKKKQPFTTTLTASMNAPNWNYENTTKVLKFRETHVGENIREVRRMVSSIRVCGMFNN